MRYLILNRYRNIFLVLLLLLVLQPLGHGSSLANQTESGQHVLESLHSALKEPPSNFARIKLDGDDLWGSRWALEQKKPVDVFHSVEIVDATLQDKSQLTLRIEFYIRQRWVAEGLEFPDGLFKPTDPPDVFLTLKESALKYMWSPKSYISTSRQSGITLLNAPVSVINIFPNKTVNFKARQYTNVACSVNFKYFPLDKQACDLEIDSYKYCDKYVSYQWEKAIHKPLINSVERLLQYDLATVESTNGTKTRSGRGEKYPYVRVRFIFERKLGNIMMQVFIPTILVVILSWFSFWLALDSVPARVTLIITCMLTLITTHSALKSSGPGVHYATMMDIWMVVCIAFVFGSIFEFVVVKYLIWYHHLTLLEAEHIERPAEEKEEDEDYETLLRTERESLTRQKSHIPVDNNLIVFRSNPANQSFLGLKNNAVISPSLVSLGGPGTGDSVGVTIGHSISTSAPSEDGNYKRYVSKESSISSSQNPEDGKNICRCKCQCFGKLEPKPWEKIDKICRGLFPFMFFIFNSVYWPMLISGSKNQALDNLIKNDEIKTL